MKYPVKAALQEQLVAARREEILDAAVKVFAQKGFHLMTRRMLLTCSPPL